MQAWDDQRRQLEGQRLISMGPKAIEVEIWLRWICFIPFGFLFFIHIVWGWYLITMNFHGHCTWTNCLVADNHFKGAATWLEWILVAYGSCLPILLSYLVVNSWELNMEVFFQDVHERTWSEWILVENGSCLPRLCNSCSWYALHCLSLFVLWNRHTVHLTPLKHQRDAKMNTHCVWTNWMVVWATYAITSMGLDGALLD